MEITLSEIAALAGGTSVIISGVAYLVGQLVINSRTEKWRSQTESKLKILENQLSEKSNILSNLIDIQRANYSLSQEKRIAAVEDIWKMFNDFLFSLPKSFLYVNSLRVNEYDGYLERSTFPEDGDIKNDIKEIETDQKVVDVFRDYRNKLIYSRPFLGEDLYTSIHSHYIFVVRIFLNTISQVEKNKLKHWQEDSYLKRLVDSALSEEDILVIATDKKNSFNYVLQQMERQILKNMNLLLSGKKASEDSHKHTEELINILSESENKILK
ncbi:hypothetical protein NAL32_07410 [Chryseobacterium sp. Ch-15]|uniref:Uncharacterized protein n=1 Tax=Chryseobacterium muglaense TaxID=2893752 RepID=A0A9Q3YQ88_9FLAO|nr:hypothetical protein [Chryseobacterium muglaense]MBD3904458.1 hypothetical protein [Chryseobacterium muglaense]MCC9032723.1 hypothetical protein [Chryseobacterium muglaense]MCM2554220.1 hypothetical protein [Chryseobacterium muglaense]